MFLVFDICKSNKFNIGGQLFTADRHNITRLKSPQPLDFVSCLWSNDRRYHSRQSSSVVRSRWCMTGRNGTAKVMLESTRVNEGNWRFLTHNSVVNSFNWHPKFRRPFLKGTNLTKQLGLVQDVSLKVHARLSNPISKFFPWTNFKLRNSKKINLDCIILASYVQYRIQNSSGP